MTKPKVHLAQEPGVPVEPILGYEGRYAVTRDGRVWSYPKRYGRGHHDGLWLQPGLKQGYPQVVLVGEDGRYRTRRVHQLVAQAYLPNPLGLPELNHQDNDPGNPHVDNLEWSTRSHNMLHAYRKGNKRGRASMAPETLAAVREAIASGEQSRSIAARLGVCETSIPGIKSGRLYAHQPTESTK